MADLHVFVCVIITSNTQKKRKKNLWRKMADPDVSDMNVDGEEGGEARPTEVVLEGGDDDEVYEFKVKWNKVGDGFLPARFLLPRVAAVWSFFVAGCPCCVSCCIWVSRLTRVAVLPVSVVSRDARRNFFFLLAMTGLSLS